MHPLCIEKRWPCLRPEMLPKLTLASGFCPGGGGVFAAAFRIGPGGGGGSCGDWDFGEVGRPAVRMDISRPGWGGGGDECSHDSACNRHVAVDVASLQCVDGAVF